MAEPQRQEPARADRPYLAADLTIEVVGRSGARTVVRIAGRLDAVAAPTVARELVEATRSPRRGPPQLAVDLSGVTYVDGAGLQVLLDAQDRLTLESGELELLAPTAAVVRLLHEAHIHGTAGLTAADQLSTGLAWDGTPLDGRVGSPHR
jgi:anti-sigma B factor antagonist